MLQVNPNKTYVYLKKDFGIAPDEFKKQCDQAIYSLGGKDTKLDFDGKVDKAVLDRMEPDERKHIFTDIQKLAGALGKVHDALPSMDKGEFAQIDLGNGENWTGLRKASNPKAHSKFEYTFRETGAQQVIFTDDNRVKLRTQGDHGAVTHEVVGKCYRHEESHGKRDHDSIFYLSESVRVR